MSFPGPAGWMHLAPNNALLLLTVGVGLIYWELNRPGLILPGAAGLLTALLAIASFAVRGLSAIGLLLVLSALALLLADLLRPTSSFIAFAATLALTLGFRWLLTSSCCPSITWPFASVCGVALGAGTSYLTRVARRARVNKGLD